MFLSQVGHTEGVKSWKMCGWRGATRKRLVVVYLTFDPALLTQEYTCMEVGVKSRLANKYKLAETVTKHCAVRGCLGSTTVRHIPLFYFSRV